MIPKIDRIVDAPASANFGMTDHSGVRIVLHDDDAHVRAYHAQREHLRHQVVDEDLGRFAPTEAEQVRDPPTYPAEVPAKLQHDIGPNRAIKSLQKPAGKGRQIAAPPPDADHYVIAQALLTHMEIMCGTRPV